MTATKLCRWEGSTRYDVLDRETGTILGSVCKSSGFYVYWTAKVADGTPIATGTMHATMFDTREAAVAAVVARAARCECGKVTADDECALDCEATSR